MSIEVTPNTVTICGTVIKRPDSIAPSQWLDFWDNAIIANEKRQRA